MYFLFGFVATAIFLYMRYRQPTECKLVSIEAAEYVIKKNRFIRPTAINKDGTYTLYKDMSDNVKLKHTLYSKTQPSHYWDGGYTYMYRVNCCPLADEAKQLQWSIPKRIKLPEYIQQNEVIK